MKKRHGAEQIVGMLRQADVALGKGKKVPEVCKQLGISEQTYYRWRTKYGGVDPQMAGGEDCFAQTTLVGKVGSFHLFAQAGVNSHRTQDFLPLNQVFAQASAGATLNFKDQMIFKSKTPRTRLVTDQNNGTYLATKLTVDPSLNSGVTSSAKKTTSGFSPEVVCRLPIQNRALSISGDVEQSTRSPAWPDRATPATLARERPSW
jgi:hypothetical protein